MSRMPATNEGARFVGRDAAFIRLAPALEAAAGGATTAAVLAGPGGVVPVGYQVMHLLSERAARLPMQDVQLMAGAK